jgi:NAD-dependent deacetylase
VIIKANRYKSVMVLTGAGISAGSGLRTYRGPGGLWNEPDTVKMSSIDSVFEDPRRHWDFWGGFRQVALAAQPNAAHLALARWAKTMSPDGKFLLATQNIDDLHQRAGSSKVVELHGSAFYTRCSREKCTLQRYRDCDPHSGELPKCPECGSMLRPDIVLFGEALPHAAMWAVQRALRDCDLFLAVGTSGTVSPACTFVDWAKYAQADTVLVNLEPMSPCNPAFDEEILGKAEEVLPDLLQ